MYIYIYVYIYTSNTRGGQAIMYQGCWGIRSRVSPPPQTYRCIFTPMSGDNISPSPPFYKCTQGGMSPIALGPAECNYRCHRPLECNDMSFFKLFESPLSGPLVHISKPILLKIAKHKDK